MTNRKGNPNWGKGGVPGHLHGVSRTKFEEKVLFLNLREKDFAGSRALKMWVEKNATQRYVPEFVLRIYGFEIQDGGRSRWNDSGLLNLVLVKKKKLTVRIGRRMRCVAPSTQK